MLLSAHITGRPINPPLIPDFPFEPTWPEEPDPEVDKPTDKFLPLIPADTIYTGSIFRYDYNGNMVYDALRKQNIRYNRLNLAKKVFNADGDLANYRYLADGTKISVLDSTENGLKYQGSLVYHQQGNELMLESAAVEGGRIIANHTSLGNNYSPLYFLTDHLGSTRVVTDGNVSNTTNYNYYPFGKLWANTNIQLSDNRYLFNGKEWQPIGNVALLDYEARMYDPELGIWGSSDRLAEKFVSSSNYVYCANNPVSAIDDDGQKTIFVNGMHRGSGGSSDYWGGFDKEVMNHFNDQSADYIDGSVGGSSLLIAEHSNMNGLASSNSLDWKFRKTTGFSRGTKDAASIIASLKRDESGNIVETLRFVTHSMGTAYAKGYIEAILQYVNEHPEECQGLQIDEYDFAAYQQNHLSAIPGVSTFQYDNKEDGVVGGFLGWLSGGSRHKRQKGAESYEANFNPKGGHGIIDFLNAASKLPPGNYRYENGKFIRIN